MTETSGQASPLGWEEKARRRGQGQEGRWPCWLTKANKLLLYSLSATETSPHVLLSIYKSTHFTQTQIKISLEETATLKDGGGEFFGKGQVSTLFGNPHTPPDGSLCSARHTPPPQPSFLSSQKPEVIECLQREEPREPREMEEDRRAGCPSRGSPGPCRRPCTWETTLSREGLPGASVLSGPQPRLHPGVFAVPPAWSSPGPCWTAFRPPQTPLRTRIWWDAKRSQWRSRVRG